MPFFYLKMQSKASKIDADMRFAQLINSILVFTN